MKKSLLDFTPEELRAEFKRVGIEPYRASQIFEWAFEKGVYDFAKMSNLPADLRARLTKEYSLGIPPIVETQKAGDDSVKLLLKLSDKDYVEAVSMAAKGRHTVCVSSQVGCKFHCAFCASGQQGFFRNLKMSEILAQVLLARDASGRQRPSNIVFMGIGEPFDNYAELLKTVRTLNSKEGLGIGARKITISTCGVVPKIRALAKEGLQIELSVSLHGPNDRVRGVIMPVNQAYPVKQLIEACREYSQATKRAITFEYILIRGINASEKEAGELGRLLEGMLCKVNLIPYNPIEEFPHQAPPYAETVQFQQILQSYGVQATVRFSKGKDIQAACGQLRSVKLKSSGPLSPVDSR